MGSERTHGGTATVRQGLRACQYDLAHIDRPQVSGVDATLCRNCVGSLCVCAYVYLGGWVSKKSNREQQ